MSGSNFHGCYFPDHSQALNHTPCDAKASQSWCCGQDAICLSNGYCLQQQGAYSNRIARHSCTDETWSSNACPSACSDTRPSNNIGLYLALDRIGGAFCCSVNYNVTAGKCQVGTHGSTEPFNLPDGLVVYNRTNGATLSTGTLSLNDLNLPASSSNTTSTATQSTTANTTTAATSNLVPVAVGIAVPLAILMLLFAACAGFLFHQNRKLKREKTQWTEKAATTSHDSHYAPKRMMSPAPGYEPKSANTNWAPYTPQSQPQSRGDYINQSQPHPHGDYNHQSQPHPHGDYINQSPPPPVPYYSAPPAHGAVEASGEHIGELESNEVKQ